MQIFCETYFYTKLKHWLCFNLNFQVKWIVFAHCFVLFFWWKSQFFCLNLEPGRFFLGFGLFFLDGFRSVRHRYVLSVAGQRKMPFGLVGTYDRKWVFIESIMGPCSNMFWLKCWFSSEITQNWHRGTIVGDKTKILSLVWLKMVFGMTNVNRLQIWVARDNYLQTRSICYLREVENDFYFLQHVVCWCQPWKNKDILGGISLVWFTTYLPIIKFTSFLLID